MCVADSPAPAFFFLVLFSLVGTQFAWNYLLLPEFGDPNYILFFLPSPTYSQGLVLGIYSREKENDVPQFTSAGESFDKLVSGKLREVLSM